MLTTEGKRKPIRAFTLHDLLYRIVRFLTTDYLPSTESCVVCFLSTDFVAALPSFL